MKYVFLCDQPRLFISFSTLTTRFPLLSLYSVERKSDKWMMTWQEFGTKRSWPNLCYYPSFRLEGLRKPRKSSGSIAALRAEVWTRDLPNMKQEYLPLGYDIRYGPCWIWIYLQMSRVPLPRPSWVDTCADDIIDWCWRKWQSSKRWQVITCSLSVRSSRLYCPQLTDFQNT
jgi:hypothetical protein